MFSILSPEGDSHKRLGKGGEISMSGGDSQIQSKYAFLLIIVASALAHLWCLKSVFYLDDYHQIVDNQSLAHGLWWQNGLYSLSYLGYFVQSKIFGMMPMGFHLVNWLLHTLCGLALYGLAKVLLSDKNTPAVPLFAALLFAVHPLGSEIPNYVRTQDMAWVTLFSLLAAWSLAMGLKGKSVWCFPIAFLMLTAAAFSKGPGLMHAMMACAVPTLLFFPRQRFAFFMCSIWQPIAVLCTLILLLWASGWYHKLGRTFNVHEDPRFIGHALTLCRVFWEFGWRMLLPIHLSADHHVIETLVAPGTRLWEISDKGALLAAGGFFLFIVGSLVLAWFKSTRLLGLCLAVFAGTILMRFAYIVPEFMPEYRIYPGLPWACLALSIILSSMWSRLSLPLARPAAVLLLVGFAFLSAQRSFVWHSTESLLGDVLTQYPTQMRAVALLHQDDLDAGRWKAIITRQSELFPMVDKALREANQKLAPGRELPTGHHALWVITCYGYYAQAIAQENGPASGLRILASLEASLKTLSPPPQRIHWEVFNHSKGLVLEMTGNYAAAAKCLRPEEGEPLGRRRKDLERVEKKLKDSKPSPSSGPFTPPSSARPEHALESQGE